MLIWPGLSVSLIFRRIDFFRVDDAISGKHFFRKEKFSKFLERALILEILEEIKFKQKNFSRPIKIVYAVNVSKSTQVYN